MHILPYGRTGLTNSLRGNTMFCMIQQCLVFQLAWKLGDPAPLYHTEHGVITQAVCTCCHATQLGSSGLLPTMQGWHTTCLAAPGCLTRVGYAKLTDNPVR